MVIIKRRASFALRFVNSLFILETSGYVERLMIQVLEPISLASAKVPTHYRPPINQMVVDQVIVSWMRHFFDNDIKLRLVIMITLEVIWA